MKKNTKLLKLHKEPKLRDTSFLILFPDHFLFSYIFYLHKLQYPLTQLIYSPWKANPIHELSKGTSTLNCIITKAEPNDGFIREIPPFSGPPQT